MSSAFLCTHILLILGVCAPLDVVCGTHLQWLLQLFPFQADQVICGFCITLFFFVCFVCILKIFVPRVSSLQSLTLGTRSVLCSFPLNLVSDTGHKSAPLWFILTYTDSQRGNNCLPSNLWSALGILIYWLHFGLVQLSGQLTPFNAYVALSKSQGRSCICWVCTTWWKNKGPQCCAQWFVLGRGNQWMCMQEWWGTVVCWLWLLAPSSIGNVQFSWYVECHCNFHPDCDFHLIGKSHLVVTGRGERRGIQHITVSEAYLIEHQYSACSQPVKQKCQGRWWISQVEIRRMLGQHQQIEWFLPVNLYRVLRSKNGTDCDMGFILVNGKLIGWTRCFLSSAVL